MLTKNSDYIGGDGGPMVVLQIGAAAQWQGAADFDESLMNGGDTETDYDVICECLGYIVRRYDRDMLVLDDSEWGARIFVLPSGAVFIAQEYGRSDELPDIVDRIAQAEPSQSFLMDVQDTTLRLLVGADDGGGAIYGYKDVFITPGVKNCNVYCSQDFLVLTIDEEKPLNRG